MTAYHKELCQMRGMLFQVTEPRSEAPMYRVSSASGVGSSC